MSQYIPIDARAEACITALLVPFVQGVRLATSRESIQAIIKTRLPDKLHPRILAAFNLAYLDDIDLLRSVALRETNAVLVQTICIFRNLPTRQLIIYDSEVEAEGDYTVSYFTVDDVYLWRYSDADNNILPEFVQEFITIRVNEVPSIFAWRASDENNEIAIIEDKEYTTISEDELAGISTVLDWKQNPAVSITSSFTEKAVWQPEKLARLGHLRNTGKYALRLSHDATQTEYDRKISAERIIYFDSLSFVRGITSASNWCGIDPTTVYSNLTQYNAQGEGTLLDVY